MTTTSLGLLSPRAIATTVLRRVLEDDAFAAAALRAELDRHPQLSPRDRAAATDLVYGSLRAARYLDGRLVRISPGLSLESPLRALLWTAAYEMAFRLMAPHPVVVSQTVELTKSLQPRATKFVNAILRKLALDLSSNPAPSLNAALVAGTPRWLRRALDRSLGTGEGDRFLAAGPLPPPLCLRVRKGDRSTWVHRLSTDYPSSTFEESPVSPYAIRCTDGGDPRGWTGIEEGALVLQEEGSQAIAEALDVLPGNRVLDACAGRGNKALLLMDRLANAGSLDAADLHGAKLERLRTEAVRFHLPLGQTFEIDASVGRGPIQEGVYDQVLIDAPCSGVGTLRRRPEILLRRTEASIHELQSLQRAILHTIAPVVKLGGTLLYAVCSVLTAECEEVLEGLSGFEQLSLRRLLPHREGSDGYAFAVLRRHS